MAAKKTVLTVLTGVGLLAATACSGPSAGNGALPEPGHLTTTTAPGSSEVDRVTWALPYGEPTTLDPAKIGDYSPQTVEANLCDTLTRMNADFSLSPGLAQKVTWSDEHTLVLDLRPGVKFWDGSPMTPEDVIHSLERQRDPKTQALYGNYLAAVTSIRATGPHQVTLRTKEYDQTLPKALSTSFGAVNQKAYTEKAGPAYGTAKGGLMCTGPFKLGSWKSGNGITLERNDAYWDTKLKPKAKQVEFQFITNSNTLTSALLSGEVDGTYELPPSSAAALGKADSGAVFLGPSTQNVLLVPGNAESPAADRKLLDALSLVIDRNALIKNVFGGDATPLKSLVPPLTWRGDKAAAQFDTAYAALPDIPEPDAEKAKKLVAQARPLSRPLVAAIPAGDQRGLQALTFVQAAAKKIGVDIEIKQLQPTEMSSLFYDPSARKDLDLILTFGYVTLPDPASYVAESVTPRGIFNWTGYNHPEVTRLLDRARTSSDPAASAKAYAEAQALFTPTTPTVFLASTHERMFMNKRISGAPSSFAYMGMPWAAYLGGTEK
ncbi:ABC transporter substrate-binding protein [Streptomyces sp. Amel2xC10]|uniref:ABC transporter substrate-binding protein n=1 Tax=Streptomyces sp. Amel2xC10 TaxID=1305826 RepID=UPI000A09058F|nr:ABC transporter substrate-binding protein [Streptomyces sp. Amel2xC10]SMF36292.1 peptide/nickel transport system substrate-binding protein [Streptomyces sp. Amel2xC10]